MKFIFAILLLGVCILVKATLDTWRPQHLARLKYLLQKKLDLRDEEVDNIMAQVMHLNDSPPKSEKYYRPILLDDLSFENVRVLSRDFGNNKKCMIYAPYGTQYYFDQCGHMTNKTVIVEY
ncbi:hypothetical protein TcasGA2_TC034268 [Tribolium castaneum]|uniref:Uncharacterized protein n=1 Tax=Tribolium castaneum TaxID=7070 RepID=A0A139WCC7_TRICA|nr:hypothetical protein TcasGA2_TC034268 [Tribolium castaneum]